MDIRGTGALLNLHEDNATEAIGLWGYLIANRITAAGGGTRLELLTLEDGHINSLVSTGQIRQIGAECKALQHLLVELNEPVQPPVYVQLISCTENPRDDFLILEVTGPFPGEFVRLHLTARDGTIAVDLFRHIP